MSQLIHQPHDKLFKLAVGDVRVARDLFIAHLPEKLLSQIDLATLELQNVSFIDEDFHRHESDILYKAKLNDDDVFIYTLCEHQSAPDRGMPYRMWKYMMCIIYNYTQQHPKKPFPIIYPMVVYTGKKKYSFSMDFFDLFKQKELAREFWQNPIKLISVCKESEKTIKQHQWFGIVELVFKCQKAQDFENFLSSFLSWINEMKPKSNDDLVRKLIRYILTEHKGANYDVFSTKAKQYLSKPLGRAAMTIADQLFQRGEKKGIRKGIKQGIKQGFHRGVQQGIQQGMQQGQSKLLWRQLKQKFKNIPEQYHLRVSSADAETLLHWGERFVTAKNLKEIFQKD